MSNRFWLFIAFLIKKNTLRCSRQAVLTEGGLFDFAAFIPQGLGTDNPETVAVILAIRVVAAAVGDCAVGSIVAPAAAS